MSELNLKDIFSGLVCTTNDIQSDQFNNTNIRINKKEDIITIKIQFKTIEKIAEISFTTEQFTKFISECTLFSNAFIHNK